MWEGVCVIVFGERVCESVRERKNNTRYKSGVKT